MHMDGHRVAFNKAFQDLGYECIQVSDTGDPPPVRWTQREHAPLHFEHTLSS